MHDALPVVALNLPATHCEQGPPLLPVAPALQEQAVAAALAAGESELAEQLVQTLAAADDENEPLAQGVQAASPTDDLKLPTEHATHGPPLGPE